MDNSLLDEVLLEYYISYATGFSDSHEPVFSKQHIKKMQKIFKLYEKNTKKLHYSNIYDEYMKPKFKLNRKTILAVVSIILISILAGCTIAYFVSNGFRGEVHKEYTKLYSTITQNGKEQIEYKYCLSEIPKGFELVEFDYSNVDVYTSYLNSQTGQMIVLQQYVKSIYDQNIDTEFCSLNEVVINNHNGLILEFIDNNFQTSILIWDNDDYIIEFTTNFDKDSTVDLAEMLKIENL